MNKIIIIGQTLITESMIEWFDEGKPNVVEIDNNKLKPVIPDVNFGRLFHPEYKNEWKPVIPKLKYKV